MHLLWGETVGRDIWEAAAAAVEKRLVVSKRCRADFILEVV